MDYQLHHDNERQMILCELAGEIRLGAGMELANTCLARLREADCYRLLMDWRETHVKVSTMDVFTFATSGTGQLDLRHSDRIAIVYERDETLHKLFESIVTKTRGLKIAYFKVRDEAENWLAAQ